MEKGGYKIVDLGDVNLIGGETVKIKGIYNQIGANNRKVILLSGITLDDVKFNDVFVETVKVGNDYLFKVFSTAVENLYFAYDIFIEENDNVTLQIKTVLGATEPASGQSYFTVKNETIPTQGAKKKNGKL